MRHIKDIFLYPAVYLIVLLAQAKNNDVPFGSAIILTIS